ncbi:hypothetical protein Tco_0628172 [Tanacetum coccineum]|uniref:Uncharacterized protein n=1 Tax=Tanacetum coccineum TaxID=301880 RepID=A0ABQ4WPH1_9ASTR
MSSPNHSTSKIKDAFSSINILNYTSVSSDYFPASSGSISFNTLENSNIITSVISPFYNNPCLKDVQAFYAKESSIPSPDPITPTRLFDSISDHNHHHTIEPSPIFLYLKNYYHLRRKTIPHLSSTTKLSKIISKSNLERISKSKRAKTSKNQQEMQRQVQERDMRKDIKAGSADNKRRKSMKTQLKSKDQRC